MRGYLDQLCVLCRKHRQPDGHPAPLVIAGDVFDKWDSPPELTNFALENLPKTRIYAVPGQHDLPHHRYEDRQKSAYWTLVAAGRVTNLEPGKPERIAGSALWGFPWGFAPEPLHSRFLPEDDESVPLNFAVVHRYLWSDVSGGYPNAPADCHINALVGLLRGFNAVVVGDNHIPAMYELGGLHNRPPLSILNHGCFIRRRLDERELKPAAGLLHADGTISVVFYDTSADTWAAAEIPGGERAGVSAAGLVRLLEQAAAGAESFRDTVNRYLDQNTPDETVAAQVRGWLETGKI